MQCKHVPEYWVDSHTGQYDAPIIPRVELVAGDTVGISEKPDERELDSFKRRLHESGLQLVYEYTDQDDFDIFILE